MSTRYDTPPLPGELLIQSPQQLPWLHPHHPADENEVGQIEPPLPPLGIGDVLRQAQDERKGGRPRWIQEDRGISQSDSH